MRPSQNDMVLALLLMVGTSCLTASFLVLLSPHLSFQRHEAKARLSFVGLRPRFGRKHDADREKRACELHSGFSFAVSLSVHDSVYSQRWQKSL